MLLALHIAVAIFSLGYSVFMYVFPSQAKLRITYLLTAATLGSGSVLVFQRPGHLKQVCITGLFYICIILIGVVLTRYKLVIQNNDTHTD